jgi:hypothetical protein
LYDAATQQAVEIVVDANLKVLVGAESKVITDIAEEEFGKKFYYKKENIIDDK